jgi:hypothetical protein
MPLKLTHTLAVIYDTHPVALHLHFHTGVACHNRNIPVAHHMLGHSTRLRRGVTEIQMSTFHLVKMWTTNH